MRVPHSVLAALLPLTLALGLSACSKDPNIAKQEHLERGDQYLAQGKRAEAIIEYRNAVQLDAQFGRARFALAEALAQSGDVQAAFGEYVRAADLLDDAEVQMKAGNFLLLAGRHEEARERADRVLAKEPKNATAHVLRANALAGLRDFAAAIDQMEAAIEADPNRGLSYASLGTFELLRGNRAESEAAYVKAVEADPNSALTHMALGQYRLALGERDAAERAFIKAAEIEPENQLAIRSLASLYLTSQQFSRAEPLLRKIADTSKDAATHFILADIYLSQQQPDRAKQELEGLLKDKASFPAAKLRLAAIDYIAGRKEAGHAHIDELLKENPKQAYGLVTKGRLLLLERKVDDAIQRLEAATAADPKYDSAQFWLGQAYAQRERMEDAKRAFVEALRLSPSYVPAQIALARLHLRLRDAEGALNYAQQAVRLAPADLEARASLVWAMLSTRDLNGAQRELNTLVRQHPDTATTKVLEGSLAMARRDAKSAERAFARALELQPDSLEALSGAMSTEFATGNAAAATARAEKMLATNPTDPDRLVLSARAFVAVQDLTRAEQILRKAIEIDSQHLAAYSLLGQIYVGQRKIPEAIHEFDELSKRQTGNVGAHTVVGMLLQVSDRRNEAKERYQRALSIDANAAVAANNLAWLQAEDGENLDVALQYAQTAVSRLPESPEVNDTLGYIYIKKGLHGQAVNALKISIERDPKNPTYHYRLGTAYAAAGNGMLARQSFDRALKLNPEFPEADAAKAALASLR